MSSRQDNSVHSRLRTERVKRQLDQKEVARVCGVSVKTVGRWEKDTPIPADKLAILAAEKNFDAYFILVGSSPDATHELLCTPDEVELIDEYRNLPEDQQAAVRQMARALSLQAVQKGTAALVRKPRKRPATDPPGEGP